MTRIAEEIARATSGLRFGLLDHHKVNPVEWAKLAQALGHDSGWALSWIVIGHSTPPPWMYCRATVGMFCSLRKPKRWRWRFWKRETRPSCSRCKVPR